MSQESLFQRLFARNPKQATGRGQGAATAPNNLYVEQAVEQMLDLFTQVSDPDLVLREAGIPRRDLRKLESDDEISSNLETRESAVTSTPWRLEPAEGSVSGFIQEQLECHHDAIVQTAWKAVPYGMSVGELMYAKDGRRTVLGNIVEKPFWWFEPKRNGELRFIQAGGDVDGKPVCWQLDPHHADPEWRYPKFLLTRRRASYWNTYGEALLSRAYWPWFFRTHGWQFWLRHLERHGSPLLIGTGANDTQTMAAALAQALQSAVAAVPEGVDVKVVGASGKGDSFVEWDGAVNRRIQKLILGRVLTSELQRVGSNAAQKTDDAVRQDRKLSDMKLCRAQVQVVVNTLTALNFGPNVKPPIYVMEDEHSLEIERAERDAKLATAKVVRFTKPYLTRTYGYDDDDIEVPATGNGANDGEAGGVAASLQRFATREADPTLSPQMQAVERLLASTLEQAGGAFSSSQLRAAITDSESPDELVEKLASMAQDADAKTFRRVAEQAVYAADLLGFAHAREQTLGR